MKQHATYLFVVKFVLIFLGCLTGIQIVHAQNGAVGIGTRTPDQSAILDINATDKGVLVPRVALASVNDQATIQAPKEGLLVYNTNPNITGGGGSGAGFYYWSGASGAPANTWLMLINQYNQDSSDNEFSRDTLLHWLMMKPVTDTLFRAVSLQGKNLATARGTLIISGGESAVLNSVKMEVNVPLVVSDSSVSAVLNSKLAKDTLAFVITRSEVWDSIVRHFIQDEKVQQFISEYITRDSVINNIEHVLKGQADSVGRSGFIALYDHSGNELGKADSSVFKYFRIGVDGSRFRDSVTLTIADSLHSGRLLDSIISIVTNTTGAVYRQIRVIDASSEAPVVNDSDYTIIIKNIPAAGTIITLPDPATSKGRMLVINQMSTAGIITTSQPVRYSDSVQSAELGSVVSNSFASTLKFIIQSDGNEWYVISAVF